MALAGRDAINFATQAHNFGILDKIFVAGVSFVTDSTVKAVGPIAKGVWGIINYSSTLDTPENKAFVAAWKKKYDGAEPTNFEGETYMGMQVIFQAVQKAKSVKPVDVAKAMSGGTFDTILGRFPIRAEGDRRIGGAEFLRLYRRTGRHAASDHHDNHSGRRVDAAADR